MSTPLITWALLCCGVPAPGKLVPLSTLRPHFDAIGEHWDAALKSDSRVSDRIQCMGASHWVGFMEGHIPGAHSRVSVSEGLAVSDRTELNCIVEGLCRAMSRAELPDRVQVSLLVHLFGTDNRVLS